LITVEKFLYEQNRKFLSKEARNVILVYEVVGNVLAQIPKKYRKITFGNIIRFSAFALATGLLSVAGFKAFIEGITILTRLEAFNIGNFIQPFGIIILGFICFFAAYLTLVLAIGMLFYVSEDTAIKFTDELLQSFHTTTGTVKEIKDGRKKLIYYTYFNSRKEEISGKFETSSPTPISIGHKIFVLYNDEFSILL
jgi:hypothetical protein